MSTLYTVMSSDDEFFDSNVSANIESIQIDSDSDSEQSAEDIFLSSFQNIKRSKIKVELKQEIFDNLEKIFRESSNAKTELKEYRKRLAKANVALNQQSKGETKVEPTIPKVVVNITTQTSPQKSTQLSFNTSHWSQQFSSTPLPRFSSNLFNQIYSKVTPIVTVSNQTPITLNITSTTATASPASTSITQNMSLGMSHNLTQQDISDIKDLIVNNIQKDDTSRLRQFSGSPKDAVSFLEDFEYHAIANNWDNDKRRTKLGTYLTNAGRDW